MTPLKLIEFKKLDNKIIKNRKFKEKKKSIYHLYLMKEMRQIMAPNS